MKQERIFRPLQLAAWARSRKARRRITVCVALLLLWIATHVPAFGQSTMLNSETPPPRKWELGVEGLRLDAGFPWLGTISHLSPVQPLAGFYLRRYMDRIGLRLGVQFANKSTDPTKIDCNDCGTENSWGTSMGMYTGASYLLAPRKAWLHAIGDLSWNSYVGNLEHWNRAWGHNHFKSHFLIHDLMVRLGLNFRFPITQHLSVGSEWTLGNGLRFHREDREDFVKHQSQRIQKISSMTFIPAGNLVLAVRF